MKIDGAHIRVTPSGTLLQLKAGTVEIEYGLTIGAARELRNKLDSYLELLASGQLARLLEQDRTH